MRVSQWHNTELYGRAGAFITPALGVVLVLVLIFLAGCSELQLGAELAKQSRRTAAGGVYKIGQPYEIEDAWYYPQEDERYDQRGIASWYGAEFQGRRTANGEIFDMNLLTAAHPTLPMPVMAEVTNLENGRSLIVRINDRGPFKKNREIDMSRRAADLLGFSSKGTALVRVRYLRKAPLYDNRGRVVSAGEPESYQVARPVTPDEQRYVSPVPKPAIQAVDLAHPDGARPRPTALVAQAFYVQLGVFSALESAATLRDKMALAGLGAVTMETVLSGGRDFYRVRIGPLASHLDAKNMADKVLSYGHQDAYIIEE